MPFVRFFGESTVRRFAYNFNLPLVYYYILSLLQIFMRQKYNKVSKMVTGGREVSLVVDIKIIPEKK